MTDDVDMPDAEPDPSVNNPLWHNEFMDLRDPMNFDAMEQTYLALQMDNMALENSHSPEGREQHDRNVAEMQDMYPYYIQAYNYHHAPENYRPEAIPPSLAVQAATPPDSHSPERANQNPVDARLLTVQSTAARSRATSGSGSRASASGSSSAQADQKAGQPQKKKQKRR
ncbi:hypothetical protein HTV45_08985 [Streptomyces sp. CHD11]|uniref:hypothetical protein n=1 Tax=Streptomyces sp. CHD11 TaxID=2741325 RepID=UPI001BFC1273|nr:hypothetical protein [Streptomyces sp. CHD11]MBT3151022.1 hypothetical protein [Streptomyces sp. CHD11]